MGSGNAFTSPTYNNNNNKYSIKEKLKKKKKKILISIVTIDFCSELKNLKKKPLISDNKET